MKNKKMSALAKGLCPDPLNPQKGLRKKSNGTFELVRSINKRQRSFSSKHPEEVWEKYAAALSASENEEDDESLAVDQSIKGPLFNDVADKYEEYVRSMKNGTQKSYLPAIQRARARFGESHMKEIEPWQIKDFLKNLGMAKTTVSNQKSVINSIYQFYIDDPIWHGDYNPASMTTIPRGLKQTRRIPPNAAQIQAVKNAANGTPSREDLVPIIYMCTGARRGECCAIQLKNIDWENNIITIERAVEWPNNRPQFTTTKTGAGVRQIPLLKMLKDALSKYRNLPKETFIVGLGKTPVTACAYKRMWSAWWKEKGFARPVARTKNVIRNGKQTTIHTTEWIATVSAHQFRHEYVCMLCEAGVKEEVAIQIIGHSNAKMVHEVYMHLKKSMLTEATKQLNQYLA